MNPKAVIIGSGVAGMASAIRLSVQGFEVDVYETNAHPGGKLTAFEQNGFHFDAGPSLFTNPEELESLFTLAGENIDEYFSYEAVDTACTYFFQNGKTVKAYCDPEKFSEEMSLVGEDKQNVRKYLEAAGKLYDHTGEIFLNHSLHKRRTWLNKRIGKGIRALKPSYLFSTLHLHNKKHFSTAEAVQIFNRYATYNGSNPFKAPGMLSLIPHLEHNKGVFYPRGGMISICEALYSLAQKKKVRFHFNSPVQRIIHHEQRALGVVVNEENVYADAIVSNVDAYFTYSRLLNHESKALNLSKHERSSSALIFYWGVKGNFNNLGLHNIFFSQAYEKEFEAIFQHKTISSDPTVYINITSKFDPSHALPGSENWFVMINVPANVGQDWEKLKATARSSIITKLNQMLNVDLEQLIVTEEILDPVSIESRTGSYMGALYGQSSNSRFAAFLRHPNFTSYIRGLYFCGGSVHPGGGLPLCFKSAKITAGLVAEDVKRLRLHP